MGEPEAADDSLNPLTGIWVALGGTATVYADLSFIQIRYDSSSTAEDIEEVYQLARELTGGRWGPGAWDFDGDGVTVVTHRRNGYPIADSA